MYFVPDSLIVAIRRPIAWYELPGLEFGHFREQNSPFDALSLAQGRRHDRELGFLGIERDSPGPKGRAPKALHRSSSFNSAYYS
jgi:hypothetical protein